MNHKRLLWLIVVWLLIGCAPPSMPDATVVPATAPAATATMTLATTSAPTPATTPEMTDVTPSPTPTAITASDAATIVPTAPMPTTGGVDAQTYLDDRSQAYALMNSFVNALNRHEYLRAYSYWEPDAEQLAPFDQFEQGYADTGHVQLRLGQAREGVAAGNWYTSVPTAMVVQRTDGATQVFVGCYQLHLANPAIQGTPPFRPLAIRAAEVEQIDDATAIDARLAQVCDPNVGSPIPAPTADSTDITADRYLDDRSTPDTVLRSFANALNRHEYVRAYGYWEDNSPQLPQYTQFEAGYADTQAVTITLGAVTGDAGAGQYYYNLPVAWVAQTTTGESQTFVGCYVLHESNAAVQATPPFRPLGIRSAEVKQVSDAANVQQLMDAACATTGT